MVMQIQEAENGNQVQRRFDLVSEITQSIVVPSISVNEISLDCGELHLKKDLFEIHTKKKWHALSTMEARCDLKRRIRLQKRGVFFTSVWQKSLFGRTLSELKEDRGMPKVFADEIVPVIREIIGDRPDARSYAVICSPRRRHMDWNFGHATAQLIAEGLGLQFFPDCCTARNRQRVNAEFSPNNVPPHANLIVYDDIVTSGQTLSSMRRLFNDRLNKNCMFFANINNKL